MLSIFSDRVLQFDLKLRSLRRITCMDGIDSSVEGKPDVMEFLRDEQQHILVRVVLGARLR